MKTYIDVFITSGYERDEDLIHALKTFGDCSDGWEFLEKESEQYSQYTTGQSCGILRVNNKHHPAVAITKKGNNVFYVPNIVPKESGRISMLEYNKIARDFARDLRHYATKYNLKIKIRSTKEDVDIKKIITGARSRELFQRYLNAFPTSHHPLDIERLDIFTHRCPVDRSPGTWEFSMRRRMDANRQSGRCWNEKSRTGN